MNFEFDKTSEDLVKGMQEYIAHSSIPSQVRQETSGMTFEIGDSNNPKYQIDAGAVPINVGSSYIGDSIDLDSVAGLLKSNPDKVWMRYQFNARTGKFDIKYGARTSFVGDSVTDAAVNLINAQLLSPANAGWLTRPFKQVLSYSNADKFVSFETGNNPFATAVNLGLLSYGGGFATLSGTGAVNNNDTFDVNARVDAASLIIMNLSATYRLTVEESMRSQYGDTSPYAGMALAAKQGYAKWVLDMYVAVLIYYGNAATNTPGLLNVVNPVAYSGNSIKTIYNGASTTKGSDMYAALTSILNPYLTTLQNQVNLVRVGFSPEVYNYLTSTGYSSSYDATSALDIFVRRYEAGAGKDGLTPKIEFYPEPLLAQSTVWNSSTSDYVVIASPEIPGGEDYEMQPVIRAVRPLDRFTLPAVPGTYQTQFKTISRYGGVILPDTRALAVYTGFGVKAGV